jgi:hypothetical protein
MFDASKVYGDVPLSAAGEASRRLEHFKDPLQFSVQRRQLQHDLQAIVFRLNFIVWGHYIPDLPAPTSEEASDLVKRFPSIGPDLIEAAMLRYLLVELTRLEREAKVAQEKEWDRIAAEEAEKSDREAFDAYEASQRDKRFRNWLERRRG